MRLVVLLKGLLRRRQAWSLGVVDQVKQQPRTLDAIAQGIELAQAGDAGLEYAVAALLVDPLARVTGQRSADLDALSGQKCGQIVLARLAENAQVAAVDDADAGAACVADQLAKTRVQLRRAAGEVQGLHRMGVEHLQE